MATHCWMPLSASKICFFVGLCFAPLVPIAHPALAQDLSGLRIGADVVSVDPLLGLEPVSKQAMGPHTAIRYELANGNSISITYRRSDRKIAYIETDWGGQQSGSFTDFQDFRFGETTLAEIRARLGHNGMAYLNGPSTALSDDGGIVSFNSYELDRDNLVVTFVTKIRKDRLDELPSDSKVRDLIGVESKMDALILSDATCLDGIWGSKKMYDHGYRRITWHN